MYTQIMTVKLLDYEITYSQHSVSFPRKENLESLRAPHQHHLPLSFSLSRSLSLLCFVHGASEPFLSLHCLLLAPLLLHQRHYSR